MLRVTKQADYGIVLLAAMASQPAGTLHNAPDLARHSNLPLPMVSKILKALARGGVLISQRGIKGGYLLGRAPAEIAVIDIIHALEGPVAITKCVGTQPGACAVERLCPIRVSWHKINLAIHEALSGITLADMVPGLPALAMKPAAAQQPAALQPAAKPVEPNPLAAAPL